MDKYCDRESDELVPSDPYLAQLADEIALENTYRSRSDGLCMHDELNASDSGDGSESAGLRRLAGTWPHEKDLSNSAHWHMSELPCLAECRRCQLEAALAPAISRPPTQGSSLPPSRADLGGDRTIQFEEALRDLFGLVECGELVRDISRDGNSDYHLRMLRLVSVLKNAQTALALTEPAVAEGQQSGKLVEKTPLFCQKPSSTKEDHG